MDTKSERQTWDLEVLSALQARDGAETAVILHSGIRLRVLNIAWGYDLGDEYAHVTTNCSPGNANLPMDFFFTSEVSSIVDPTDLAQVLSRRYSRDAH